MKGRVLFLRSDGGGGSVGVRRGGGGAEESRIALVACRPTDQHSELTKVLGSGSQLKSLLEQVVHIYPAQ